MLRNIIAGLLAPLFIASAPVITSSAHAAERVGIPGFKSVDAKTGDITLHYRDGGSESPVVLIHGYTQTGDSWKPLAVELAKTHRVIVPDLRGVGRSSIPSDGNYTKKSAAKDIHELLRLLNINKAAVVGHDIGLMVAYAYAAQWPEEVSRLVVMDAPLPGISPWDQVKANPALWHFNFHGATAEALVKGRERIYFEKFWNGFAANPKAVHEFDRRLYTAAYSKPGRMAAGFGYFAALDQDAKDNMALSQTKLTMPVLAIGGEKSAGELVGAQFSQVANQVKPMTVAGSGHWLLEEVSKDVSEAIVGFLKD